jgi:hypothetical protein
VIRRVLAEHRGTITGLRLLSLLFSLGQY